MKIRFIMFVLFSFVTISAQAASIDDLRLHYYFLRGSLAGQYPFAKSLNEFRTHFDRLRADPLNTNVSIYQKSQELIETNPKDATTGDSSQILTDLRTISETKYQDSAKVFKSLSLYSIATRYLTSGPMRAPPAYEALGLQSERELGKFREDIIFLTTKSNAGILSAEEQQALDLLFRYYTGVTTRLSKETIMEDPLMLPVKDSAAIEGRLKAQLSGDLGNLVRSTRLTQNLVQTLRSQIEDQNLQRTLQEASTQLQQAKSFAEIDKIVNRLDGIRCEGQVAAACNAGKNQVIQLAEEGKERIARFEFGDGIEQSIQLGIVVGRLTKSEDLTKSFQALKAVNDAYHAYSAGMTAFGSASTTMGQVGAIAGAATGVIGAVVVISSLMDSGGQSGDQAILASLQELKGMIVQLSAQIETGFKDSAKRTDRIEALLESYSNLASKNNFVLQQEIVALREDVRAGAQPLESVRLSYTEQLHNQFKSLSEKGIAILLNLPTHSMTPLFDTTKQLLTGLFAELFTITAAIEKGEYNIAISPDQAADAHLSVINQLAAYPPSPFRTAFLIQNAINASQRPGCADVNLIGLLMISEAATQVNEVLGSVSHFQLSEYFESPTTNSEQFRLKLKKGRDVVESQRRLVTNCLSKAFYQDFERVQLSKLLALVEGQRGAFFDDGSRLNDMLVTLMAKYALPGGFHRDNFIAGHLIQQTRSFEPEAWEKIAPLPSVLPIYDLGTRGVQMTREDFVGFIPTYQTRLGPNLGADFQFYVETWWTPFDKAQLNRLPLQIALTSPRSKKLIHMWRGVIDRQWLTDPSLYGDRFQSSNNIRTLYFRLVADSLPRVYAMLNDREIGLLGTMDGQYGNRGNVFKWSPQQAAQYCNTLDGFYECNGAIKQQYRTYTDFQPANFFTGPVNSIKNGDPGSSLPPARAVSMDWFSSYHNQYRKEFSDGMIAYVNYVRETTTTALTPCLLNLVQGTSSTCDIAGFANVYRDRTGDYRRIEEYNLIRMTFEPSSTEIQRIIKLTDLKQISSIEVEPIEFLAVSPMVWHGADATIHRITRFIEMLKERLAALERESTTGDSELSPELFGVLENDHDWLNNRLNPFLSNSVM